MVTQLRIMEWYPSLTARQTVNVFVLTHIALPSPDDKEKRKSCTGLRSMRSSESQPFRGQSLYMKKIAKA